MSGHPPQAVTDAEIAAAHEALAALRAQRALKEAARAAAHRLYAEQAARHIQHPQSRGGGRKMLSKP